MSKQLHRLGIHGLAFGSVLVLAASAHAQGNPYFISPQQYYYNMQMARYGNPYSFNNALSGAGANPYTPFASPGGVVSGTSNPYTTGSGGYGANPYDTSGGNPYNPFFYGSG